VQYIINYPCKRHYGAHLVYQESTHPTWRCEYRWYTTSLWRSFRYSLLCA
jgi:hypothetical protein